MMNKVQDQNVEVDDDTLGQNEMGVGDMEMQRHVEDYTRKGKEDEHMDLHLDVHKEEVGIEKEADIENEVGIEEELHEDMHMDYGMDMKGKSRNYP